MQQLKIVSLLTMLILLINSQSFFAQEESDTSKTSSESKTGMVYQCPKHLGVISNVSGRCNKCDSVLEELTMDEAMDNLSGEKKPELKNKKIYKVDEIKSETDDNLQAEQEDQTDKKATDVLKDKTTHNHSDEHEAIVILTDLNRDGYVYQCQNCPDQLSDTPDDCEECFKDYVRVSVEQAKKNVPECDH